MKFTFLKYTIFSLVVCFACGSLDIYQEGGNVRDDDAQYQSQLVNSAVFKNLYLSPQWRASIPWINMERAPFSKQISEKLRKYINIRRRQEIMQQQAEEQAVAAAAADLYRAADDYTPKAGGKAMSAYSQYQLKYPNQQMLDDVRPYPSEDSDFTFYNSDTDAAGGGEEDSMHHHQQHGEMEMDGFKQPQQQEASGVGSLSDVQLVSDPGEFAYAPTDQRYFQDSNYGNNYQQDAHSEEDENRDQQQQSDDEDQIFITHRNDVKFIASQYQNGDPNGEGIDVVGIKPFLQENIESAGVYIIAIVAGISAACTVGLIAFVIGWYNLQKHVKSTSDVEYPAYGVTGPNKEVSPSGDRRLAQSAQMYHYQHQKQQIIAMERAAATERHGSISEADSDEENEEGDYTVYECPGLAPTGEMEVKNPLFQDDPTPAQTPQTKQQQQQQQQQQQPKDEKK